jgi:hypothetical protein
MTFCLQNMAIQSQGEGKVWGFPAHENGLKCDLAIKSNVIVP